MFSSKEFSVMGMNAGVTSLATWPWEQLGMYKYMFLCVPIMLKAAYGNLVDGKGLQENVWFHLFLASALRYLHVQLWMSTTRFHAIVKKYQIQKKITSFERKDREANWDNYIILQLLVAICMVAYNSNFNRLPLWNGKGIVCLFLLHAGPTEYLYYWCHRTLHESPTLYKCYHAFHHATSVPEPTSGFILTFAEALAFTALVSIPMFGAGLLGMASLGMFYCYWLFLDFHSAIAHCNWEFVPRWMFKVFPALKYLVLTPTYHSLHHTGLGHSTNYALSIPLYDYLAGTFDLRSDSEHALVRQGQNNLPDNPDFVFLVHEVGLDSVLHLGMGLVSFHTEAFRHRWFVTILMPITVPIMLLMWAFGTPFLGMDYTIGKIVGQYWIMPRFGFRLKCSFMSIQWDRGSRIRSRLRICCLPQYFLSSERESINRLIEEAILEADHMGVKVLALGALNKMEELNEGGLRFLKRQPHLRLRLCHGNTLTACVIVNGLPVNVTEIFLTGATSKLGRAVSVYLAKHGVRVLMLTRASSRFEAVLKDCPDEYKHNLIQVTKYQDGQHCKTWVLGKPASARDQKWALRGTKLHQFVVPTVPTVRKDCIYGALAAMQLPKHVEGIDCCEFELPRGVVHACHAGGLVHVMEGWTHHEIGPIPVDRIEIVWKAAIKHGFRPVESGGGFLDHVISQRRGSQRTC